MAIDKGTTASGRPAVGKRVVQLQRPGNGWFYLGQNKAGENIWEYRPGSNDAPKQSAPPSGGGGGGGGGGGSASPGLSSYIQEYRLRFRPEGDPPADLLKKAEAGNWSLAYFDQQVRLKDSSYLTSLEAKTLLPDFAKTMKILFPGLANRANQKQLMKSSFYRKAAQWYLRNGVGLQRGGEEALFGWVTNTGRWNKANPYWKDYAANPNIGVQVESNPLVYKTYLQTLRQSFKDMGMELPDDYYRAFFKSRYASKNGISEMQGNLKQIAQQGQSFGWFEGQNLTKEQKKQTIFGGQQQTDLRSRLAKSFGVRRSFLSGDTKGTETTLSNENKLIKPLI